MKLIHSLIILSVIFTLSSNAAQAEILEKDAIYDYKLEILSEKPRIFKISGLCAHSALSVERIYTKTEDKTIAVYIKLIFAPKDPKYSGSFEYLLEIPDRIDMVKLGEKKTIIWERNKSIIPE